MYKVLIIDDEIEQREKIYKRIFDKAFQITLISNKEEEIVNVLKNNLFDGIVLDSTLTSGAVTMKVQQCIKKFNGAVILVSDKREFDDSDRGDNQICDCISLRPLFNCIEAFNKEDDDEQKKILKAIENGIIKDIQDRTRVAIRNVVGYKDNQKNNKLSICHIADLQFGDPSANEFDLNVFFTRLTTYLRDREPKPDLVVIAGDIVFSGKKEEFALAESHIVPFLESIYGEEYHKHLIMVPGNHDYNYSSYLSDKNISETVEESVSNKDYLTPSDFKKFIAPDSASYYFCDFASRMTKNTDYWSLPLKIENRQLMPYGYRILGISNASEYQALNLEKGSKRYILNTEGLNVDQAAGQKQPPTIAVGHISPTDLGYKNVCPSTGIICNKFYEKQCREESQCRKWATSQVFLEAYNSVVYLYGHKHFASCEISDDNKRLFVAAGTPSGIDSEMTFNIIEIEDNKEVDMLTLIVNSVNSASISMAKCEKYKYIKSDKKWEKDK